MRGLNSIFVLLNCHCGPFIFIDKYIDADVTKARITATEAQEAKPRLTIADSLSALARSDFVIEVCHEFDLSPDHYAGCHREAELEIRNISQS